MTDPEAIDKTANRFETGFIATATHCLEKISEDWGEQSRPVLLLRALCQLTAEHEDRHEQGFIPLELVEQISKIVGYDFGGYATVEPNLELIRKTITKHWKALETIWAEKKLGVYQRFQDQQLSPLPDLVRQEGGGRGHPTRYSLRFNENSAVPVQDDSLPDTDNLQGYTIRYYTDEIASTRFLRWLAQHGYSLTGWRSGVFLSVSMLVWLGIILLMGFLWWSLMRPSNSLSIISTLTSLVTWVVLAWILLRPLIELAFNRITRAPIWLQSFRDSYDDRLLELRRDAGKEANSIYLTRYLADCPLCSGKVHIASGRLEFFGRLVGRCSKAPVEHVFSFDHVLRRGKNLR